MKILNTKDIEIKCFLIILIGLALTSCMKPDVDSEIPLNWTLKITDLNSNGNKIEINGLYKDFGSGSGDDGIFGTGDDGLVGYNYLESDSNGELIDVNYISAGEDNVWFTEDDDIEKYIKPENIIGSSGVTTIDGGFNNFIFYREYNSSGLDGIWLTDDDNVVGDAYISVLIKMKNKIVYIDEIGEDHIIGSSDDVILKYEKIIEDGDLTTFINYVSAGSDGLWFTDDDIIGAYDVNELPNNDIYINNGEKTETDPFAYIELEKSNDGDFQIVTTSRYAKGDDNIWFTNDDVIVHQVIQKYKNDDLLELIESKNPGNDRIILTADDPEYIHYKLRCDDSIERLKSISSTSSFGNDGLINTGDEIWNDLIKTESKITKDGLYILNVMIESYYLVAVSDIQQQSIEEVKLSGFDQACSRNNYSYHAHNYDINSVYNMLNHIQPNRNWSFDHDNEWDYILDSKSILRAYSYTVIGQDNSVSPFVYGYELEKQEAGNKNIRKKIEFSLNLGASLIVKDVDFLSDPYKNVDAKVLWKYLKFSEESQLLDGNTTIVTHREFWGDYEIAEKSRVIIVDRTSQ